MSKILILSLIFRPDNVSTAQIMGDIALDLKSLGHEIYIISTVPHYNKDEEALANQPLKPYLGRLIQKSKYHGMDVLHVWMPHKETGRALRIISWLGFHLISTLAGVFCRFKPDIILTPSPPLTIGISAWIISKFRGCRFIYNVQEIYPDVAVNLGIIRNRIIINLFRLLENFVYSKSESLTVISEGMARNIRRKNVPDKKIRIIPNFVDVEEFHPLPRDNDFSRSHNLNGKFIVSYAGNMGKPQGLIHLIEAADLIREEEAIHFLIVGDGSERESLMEYSERLKLPNVTFIPYQPYSLMPQAYATADVSFVSQASGTSDDAIPSKVYRIMACARPVIACTDPGSDLEKLITNSDSGVAIPTGQAKLISDAVLNAFKNQESWLIKGQKAREIVVQNYSRAKISSSYDQLFGDILKNVG